MLALVSGWSLGSGGMVFQWTNYILAQSFVLPCLLLLKKASCCAMSWPVKSHEARAGGQQWALCPSAHERLKLYTATWVSLNESPRLAKPSDDCSPVQHLDCILVGDLEAEDPAELHQIPEHRNLEIMFVILNLYFFNVGFSVNCLFLSWKCLFFYWVICLWFIYF